MTDPNDYTATYTHLYQQQSFETIMVWVRRKRVLASLRAHSHRHILEIGCGLEPLFTAWDDYETFTLVEPSEAFVEHAHSLAVGQDRVQIYQGYVESVYR